jgi:hypothetical protein
MNIRFHNKELYKLSLLIAVFVALASLFFAKVVDPSYCFGLILSLLVLTYSQGVEFDPVNKRYRNYKSFLFMRKGVWKEIGENKELVVLVKHGTKSTTGTMMTASLKIKGGFSELYLMNATHTNRFFIDSSENHEQIDHRAFVLSQQLGLPIRPFSPRWN